MRVLSRKLLHKGFGIQVLAESAFTETYLLTRHNTILAHMKFSSHLDEHYNITYDDFEAEHELVELCDRLDGHIGITEVQARKSTAQMRENVPYHEILFRAYRQSTKTKPTYIMSTERSFYRLDSVRKFLENKGIRQDEKKFYRNYDKFALRNGYKFHPELRVFVNENFGEK